MSNTVDANVEIEVIRNEIENAADNILSAATNGLSFATEARGGNLSAIDDIEQLFCSIIECCSFQDIAGQRLARLKNQSVTVTFSPDELLHGPAAFNSGVTQEDADKFFSSTTNLSNQSDD